MKHIYGEKMPLPSYDRIYYQQCRKCDDILLVVKTRDFNLKTLLYTINDKVYYDIRMENIYIVPKGDLANECSIVNYTPNICHSPGKELPNVCYIKKSYKDVWVPKERKIAPWDSVKTKHLWVQIDYFHQFCQYCGLLHLWFEFPRAIGMMVDEFYDLYKNRLWYLGNWENFNEKKGMMECIGTHDEKQRKMHNYIYTGFL